MDALVKTCKKNRERDFEKLRKLVVDAYGTDDTMTDEQFKTRVETARFNRNLRTNEVELVGCYRDTNPKEHTPREKENSTI